MLIDSGMFDRIQDITVDVSFGAAAVLVILAVWKKRLLFAGLGALAFLTAIGAILLPDSFTTPVFVATAGNHGIRVTRNLLIGTQTYRFANGQKSTVEVRPGPAELVIDDTKQPLEIMEVTYSAGGGFGSQSAPAATIEPFHATYTDLWIQYYGNGAHQPPETAKIYGDMEQRYWLTWE